MIKRLIISFVFLLVCSNAFAFNSNDCNKIAYDSEKAYDSAKLMYQRFLEAYAEDKIATAESLYESYERRIELAGNYSSMFNAFCKN